VSVQVDLKPNVCYVDKDRFDDHVDIVMGVAANCAMTDYLLCQDN